MTPQYEEQAAISSDINIYLIRTSRWKDFGLKKSPIMSNDESRDDYDRAK